MEDKMKWLGHKTSEEIEGKEMKLQYELLKRNYRLGHVPFNILKNIPSMGKIPRNLAKCTIPKCAACLYGKATRRQCRTKLPPNQIRMPIIEKPGDCVSLDQMESPLPGLIGQMKGKLTRSRYRVATVIVDHYSDLSYVHLHQSTTCNETLNAKKCFEKYASSRYIQIQHYHCDNGRVVDNLFKNHIREMGQPMLFCVFNAHFQNGKAEKIIIYLQEVYRTMIFHSQSRWHGVITQNLWPYTLMMDNSNRNDLPRTQGGVSPMEKFT